MCEPITMVHDRDESAVNMMLAMSNRFEAMSRDDRDSYLEKARRALTPSYHNDRNIVLATALELFMNDESMRGTLV
ncbi:MAG: hypothetical protein ACYC7L_00970 [Nitrospirota bacterium]